MAKIGMLSVGGAFFGGGQFEDLQYPNNMAKCSNPSKEMDCCSKEILLCWSIAKKLNLKHITVLSIKIILLFWFTKSKTVKGKYLDCQAKHPFFQTQLKRLIWNWNWPVYEEYKFYESAFKKLLEISKYKSQLLKILIWYYRCVENSLNLKHKNYSQFEALLFSHLIQLFWFSERTSNLQLKINLRCLIHTFLSILLVFNQVKWVYILSSVCLHYSVVSLQISFYQWYIHVQNTTFNN